MTKNGMHILMLLIFFFAPKAQYAVVQQIASPIMGGGNLEASTGRDNGTELKNSIESAACVMQAPEHICPSQYNDKQFQVNHNFYSATSPGRLRTLSYCLFSNKPIITYESDNQILISNHKLQI